MYLYVEFVREKTETKQRQVVLKIEVSTTTYTGIKEMELQIHN